MICCCYCTEASQSGCHKRTISRAKANCRIKKSSQNSNSLFQWQLQCCVTKAHLLTVLSQSWQKACWGRVVEIEVAQRRRLCFLWLSDTFLSLVASVKRLWSPDVLIDQADSHGGKKLVLQVPWSLLSFKGHGLMASSLAASLRSSCRGAQFVFQWLLLLLMFYIKSVVNVFCFSPSGICSLCSFTTPFI